eukprot:COSAG03_NODE_3714_length_1864_cov_1.098017_3_plen_189_part_00
MFGSMRFLEPCSADGAEFCPKSGAFERATDVRFPVLDSDTAFAVEFDYDGELDTRAYVQFAYLYTTSYGQRRIRVSTVAAGVSTVTGTLFRSADCEALVGFACRQACRDLQTQPVSVIRDRLTMTCVDILAAYRKHCTASPSSGTVTSADRLLSVTSSPLPPAFSSAGFAYSPCCRCATFPLWCQQAN